jgi:hypothetical protein
LVQVLIRAVVGFWAAVALPVLAGELDAFLVSASMRRVRRRQNCDGAMINTLCVLRS